MQYKVQLDDDRTVSLYYSDKVYSPEYSDITSVAIGNVVCRPGDRVLDVACGMGLVGLLVKCLKSEIKLTLSDIDPEAIRIAKLNAKKLGVEATFKVADMLPPGDFDVIFANFPTYDVEDMEKHPLYGPEVAYAAGKDGLSFYRRFFAIISLRNPTILVLQCQDKLAEGLEYLAETHGWKLVQRENSSFVFEKLYVEQVRMDVA